MFVFSFIIVLAHEYAKIVPKYKKLPIRSQGNKKG
jgi:hypothetical protein